MYFRKNYKLFSRYFLKTNKYIRVPLFDTSVIFIVSHAICKMLNTTCEIYTYVHILVFNK